MKKMDNYIDVGPTKAGEKGAACRKQPKKDTLKVYKANTVIQANYQLTLVEQRVLLACIAKINPREPVPSVVRLSAQEYATIYSTQVKQAYQALKNASGRLHERTLEIVKEIARLLGRSPSTISRELRRNKGLRGYRPKQALRLSDARRKGAGKACKVTDDIRAAIGTLIRQELSPQQIVGYLARHKSLSLHHETVYQLIYADKASGGDLYTHLRVASKPYRKHYGSYDRRGKIKNRVSIDDRPAVVDRGTRIGDWEGDTVIGKGRKSALLTMVERKTLYTVIVRLTGKHADLLTEAAVQNMRHLKDSVKTITFDNGLEFAEHEAIAEGLDADIYFAHPYASWERGINENTNGSIRQYFPKGTDFNEVSDTQIEYVMNRLNNRPRATRGNRSPNELFMGQREDLLAA